VDEQRIDLYLLLHHALLRLGEHQRCLEVLRQATTLAETLDDARRLGWISSYMSTDCLLMGDAEAATTAGQRALALAMVCEDQALQVDAQLHLGQAYHAVSEYRRAMEMLRHNVPLSDITHDMHSAAWLVWCLAEIGDFTDGIRYGREAIQGAEQLNHPYALVAIYGAVGLLYLRQGVLDQAIPLLERSLELCRSADILLMLPSIAAHMGAAYTLHGRLADAMPLLEFAVTQATAQQLMVHHVLHLIALSEAKLLAGQGEVARTLARRALHMAQSRKERGHEAYALRLLGAIAAAQVLHQEHAAVTFYQQALTLAQALGMRPLVAHCHLGLGLYYSRNGQMAQARSALMLAHDLFQSMAMTFWLPQVDTALAQMR
jgi:tetratricopeptide (TPR) repeat protein